MQQAQSSGGPPTLTHPMLRCLPRTRTEDGVAACHCGLPSLYTHASRQLRLADALPAITSASSSDGAAPPAEPVPPCMSHTRRLTTRRMLRQHVDVRFCTALTRPSHSSQPVSSHNGSTPPKWHSTGLGCGTSADHSLSSSAVVSGPWPAPRCRCSSSCASRRRTDLSFCRISARLEPQRSLIPGNGVDRLQAGTGPRSGPMSGQVQGRGHSRAQVRSNFTNETYPGQGQGHRPHSRQPRGSRGPLCRVTRSCDAQRSSSIC